MSTLFTESDRFSAVEVPPVSKFQRLVQRLNTHMFHRKSKSEDPGNYEHWAESIKYDTTGESVYDELKRVFNSPELGDRKCATVVISRSPDELASKKLFNTTYNFVCNGEHDELRIQQAYNLISEVGYGKIFLRKGRYDITSQLKFSFPPLGKESNIFNVVIEGEQGSHIYHHIPGEDLSVMAIIETSTGFSQPATLTFRNLNFESIRMTIEKNLGGIYSEPYRVARYFELRDNSSRTFNLMFENCGFFISDESYGFGPNVGNWITISLIGKNKCGNVWFKDCYFKRIYNSSARSCGYTDNDKSHLGNIIKADKLNSLTIDGCIFEDRGARHEFDPFVYSAP